MMLEWKRVSRVKWQENAVWMELREKRVSAFLVFNIFNRRRQLFGVRVELREAPGAVLMLPVVFCVFCVFFLCAVWKMERFHKTNKEKTFFSDETTTWDFSLVQNGDLQNNMKIISVLQLQFLHIPHLRLSDPRILVVSWEAVVLL